MRTTKRFRDMFELHTAHKESHFDVQLRRLHYYNMVSIRNAIFYGVAGAAAGGGDVPVAAVA